MRHRLAGARAALDGREAVDLLDRAGVKPEATALRFVSFDGEYTESLTLDQARRPDVMVAYELEGKPLSSDHGGPVRLYVAPMYGYKSCKWLQTHRAHRRGRARATGRTTATTSTVGSAAATAATTSPR